jgi:hypothetical protein
MYNFINIINIRKKKKSKVIPIEDLDSLSVARVDAPTFSDIRLIDGGKVVSPTHRPLFTPRKVPSTHLC